MQSTDLRRQHSYLKIFNSLSTLVIKSLIPNASEVRNEEEQFKKFVVDNRLQKIPLQQIRRLYEQSRKNIIKRTKVATLRPKKCDGANFEKKMSSESEQQFWNGQKMEIKKLNSGYSFEEDQKDQQQEILILSGEFRPQYGRIQGSNKIQIKNGFDYFGDSLVLDRDEINLLTSTMNNDRSKIKSEMKTTSRTANSKDLASFEADLKLSYKLGELTDTSKRKSVKRMLSQQDFRETEKRFLQQSKNDISGLILCYFKKSMKMSQKHNEELRQNIELNAIQRKRLLRMHEIQKQRLKSQLYKILEENMNGRKKKKVK